MSCIVLVSLQSVYVNVLRKTVALNDEEWSCLERCVTCMRAERQVKFAVSVTEEFQVKVEQNETIQLKMNGMM